jgi:hypothetical protein
VLDSIAIPVIPTRGLPIHTHLTFFINRINLLRITDDLDVTVQAEILDPLREIRDRRGNAICVITHNMVVVADSADRVIVTHDGKIVEKAPVGDLFHRPAEEYTRTLLPAVPRMEPHPEKAASETGDGAPVLAVENLTVDRPGGDRPRRPERDGHPADRAADRRDRGPGPAVPRPRRAAPRVPRRLVRLRQGRRGGARPIRVTV